MVSGHRREAVLIWAVRIPIWERGLLNKRFVFHGARTFFFPLNSETYANYFLLK